MPNGIVTETCSASECNLTDQEVGCFMDEISARIQAANQDIPLEVYFYGR